MPAAVLNPSSRPRILIIDDNQDIHRDFRLAFGNESHNPELQATEELVFPSALKPKLPRTTYQLEHSLTGMEGIEKVRRSVAARQPFQLAFVDIRMPGIDGVETVARFWQIDPLIQVVIVTAYADYSWEDLEARLGRTDKLLLLKKPFEYLEVVLMASTLMEKWFLGQQAALKLEQMELLVSQRTQRLLELQRSDTHTFPTAQNLKPAETSVSKPGGENPGTVAEKDLPLVLLVKANTGPRQMVAPDLGPDYRIVEVADNKQGLEQAREMVPDLIISETLSPELDGLALCRQLKHDELSCHIPVILLGSHDAVRCQVRALEAGADDFIVAPFAPGLLRGRVDNLLRSRCKLQENILKDTSLQPRELATNQVDAQFLRRTTEEIEKYMSDFEFDVEALSRKIFVSRRQLLRKIKALAGCAPNVLIRRLRLKRAAELLKSSGLTVSEITYAVGFSDLKHFRSVFREQYGMSPGEYARRAEESKA